VPEVRGVAGLEVAAGVRFSSIWAARDLTERGLVERRKRVATLEADRDATVVLMGSWGRSEVTSESDDDFMVVFEGPSREDACPTIDEVAELLGGRAPGSEKIFGEQVWLDDLRGKIGRDEDSNANLTRRMLFVLESVPVCGDATHARALMGLLTGYLEANVKDHRPPRFLLNDLIRYWRTIAVDFESKMRDRRGEGWGLRNAKLRLSRKALFAGGLLPVLECYRYASDEMASYLGERMSVPPLDRIADVFVDHRALDAGVRSLSAYDEFLAILGDGDKRRQLTELGVDAAAESPLFARVAELGREFEGGLLALLFDDPELRRRMREYIVF
jgi:predicted nucleotidyltransferase